jgi:SAM-dependent methyltransferase
MGARHGDDTEFAWVNDRPGSVQDEVNRRVYSSPRLVRAYARRKLSPAERVVFERYAGSFEDRRVLELGCGAGRLTGHLLQASRDVVGIDVSAAMVTYCRRNLPAGTFVVGDMRDLSGFADGSFDVVVAGANVLDAVSHEERLAILAAIRRLLRPGGLLYFSSHNRHSRQALGEARDGPRFRLAKNPYRQMRAAANYVQGRLNHPRFAQYQRFEVDHAILNDEAHGWRLLHYYVDRAAQADQLVSCGFDPLETIGSDGKTLGPRDDDAAFTELHYVARSR